MDFTALQSEFSAIRARTLHLNNAGMCPPPASSVALVNRFNEAYAGGLMEALTDEFAGYAGRVRRSLAALIGAGEDDIALTRNTAEGLNIVAQGFPFAAGDVVLTSDKEYSCNVLPWLNLADRGVTVAFIPEVDGAVRVEDVESRLTPAVRLVALSQVQWCSGYRVDLEAIGALCAERGIPLVIDAAQGVGAVTIDVQRARISALACPAWKWLWGPLGLGFLYMTPEFLERVRPVFVGAEGVASWQDPLAYTLAPRAGMRRFEYSTMNYADVVQWARGLELHEALGPARIEARLLELTEAFAAAARAAGGQVYGDAGPARRSGIFSFTHPAREPLAIRDALAARGVTVQVRDGRVRVAPHVYLDGGDAARFGTALAAVVRGI